MDAVSQHLSVLVINADPDHAADLAHAVRKTGHRVLVVGSGERAIDHFIQSPSDVLIVDMNLPGRDGLSTIEAIRWAPSGGAAWIVLTSGKEDSARLSKLSTDIGAVLSLSMPTDLSELPLLLQRRSESVHSFEGQDELSLDEIIEVTVEEPPKPTPPTPKPALPSVPSGVMTLDASTARLQGRLDKVPFPSLLARLNEHRATGSLHLSSAGDPRSTTNQESPQKTIHFRNGIPTHVVSNLVEECLGQMLKRNGVIKQSILEESVQRVNRGEGRQGAILMAMNALGPHELKQALHAQQEHKLLDVFGWPMGGYRFVDGPPPLETLNLDEPLSSLVRKGVVQRIPTPRLLAMLEPSLECFVVPNLARMRNFIEATESSMSQAMQSFLRSLDGSLTLSEAIKAGPSRVLTAQTLFVSECLGCVAFREHQAEAIREDFDDLSASNVFTRKGMALADLKSLLRLLKESRFAEALQIPDDKVTEQAVNEAIIRIEAVLKPMLSDQNTPRTDRTIATQALAILPNAYRMLDRNTKEIEADAQAPLISLSRSEPIDEDEDEDAEGIDAAILADDKRRSSLPPVLMHQDDFADEAGVHSIAKEVRTNLSKDEGPSADFAGQSGVGTKPSVLTERTGVAVVGRHQDADYPLVENAQSSEITTTESTAPAEVADPVTRMLKAERYFKRGARALDRSDAATALRSLLRAVSLCPHEGEFVSFLGYARFQVEEDPSEALAELERGCRTAPTLPVVHLLLGRVRLARDEIPEAINAYESALMADPDCQEALDTLRQLVE